MLARQGLLEPLQGTIAKTLAASGGLQAQYAPSMYVGLWSRMGGALERAALTQALERRTVVQATLMRITIHLVAKRDFWPFALATRAARRELWLRSMRGGTDEAQMTELAARVREHLTKDGRADQPQGARCARRQAATRSASASGSTSSAVPPAGTWERRRADLFAAAEDWVGPAPDLSDADAVAQLVRGYLAGFGPASRADIASYTGLAPRDLALILDGMRLRRFRSESGDELLDVARAPLPDPEQPAPVRFLPTWDTTLLVHARRARILPEEHRPKIFHVRNPHSTPTFLVDGAVAGTWRHRDGAIELEPFAPLDRATRRELRAEADRLAAFHA